VGMVTMPMRMVLVLQAPCRVLHFPSQRWHVS